MIRAQPMKIGLPAFALIAVMVPANLYAQDGGMLGTMPKGNYECAFPGSAATKAIDHRAEEDFRLSSASRYSTADGSGTYLLKGDIFTFTRGPKKGDRYLRVGIAQLRKLDDQGNTTRLLCVRRGG